MKISDKKIREKNDEIIYQEQLAEDGDAEAQNIIAARLAKGYFVEKDEQGAFYWYCQAIKQGYVYAKWNAGSMLLHGDGGIPKNEELAMMLIEDAANSGVNDACIFLSFCYLNGKHGKGMDIDLSKQWNKEAKKVTEPQYFGRSIDLVLYGVKTQKPVMKFTSK
ncbi:MAG: sel1 repeat family protein [Candidatus Thiodiazotropha sp. (ex Lucinoma kastoroae)]|nr:sel1 repeat family protein [Candidatus Thiodiazotropha sp. (ex Lucinoma kastoroae)]